MDSELTSRNSLRGAAPNANTRGFRGPLATIQMVPI